MRTSTPPGETYQLQRRVEKKYLGNGPAAERAAAEVAQRQRERSMPASMVTLPRHYKPTCVPTSRLVGISCSTPLRRTGGWRSS